MTQVIEGTGNVFADLGFPNPQEEQAKAELTRRIYLIIKERGLTQTQAGRILGVKQPDVSLLMRGRYTGFSIERLFSLLLLLGQDIDIMLKPRTPTRQDGEIHVFTVS
jgi:predicted XRE-type DNA-binding protein